MNECGSPIEHFPAELPRLGVAKEHGILVYCFPCEEAPTHVEYGGIPICLACAVVLDSRGAGRSEEALLKELR